MKWDLCVTVSKQFPEASPFTIITYNMHSCRVLTALQYSGIDFNSRLDTDETKCTSYKSVNTMYLTGTRLSMRSGRTKV
jgi:hypothetical protein